MSPNLPRIVVIQQLDGPPSGQVRAGLRRMARWAQHVVVLVAPEHLAEIATSERIEALPLGTDWRPVVERVGADWVLFLEADEFLDAEPQALLHRVSLLEGAHATIPRLDLVEPHRARLDGEWSPGRLANRLIRYTGNEAPGEPTDHLPMPILCYRYLGGRNADRTPKGGPSVVTKKWPEQHDAKVLITAPVRDAEPFLEAYLDGLDSLAYPKDRVSIYWLANDCSDRTVEILKAWRYEHRAEWRSVEIDVVELGGQAQRTPFDSADAHFWDEQGWRRMCGLRTQCLSKAADNDFVLFVDSDTVLLPPTLGHLVNLEGVDVLTEVHWTSWKEGDPPHPNVWSGGQYHFAYGFMKSLVDTTVMPVGGMGGVVLIPRRVLQAGATYLPIPNLDYQGEDRHFCVRIAAMGFRLHADTYYPAIHIYRQSVLEEYRAMKGQRI